MADEYDDFLFVFLSNKTATTTTATTAAAAAQK